MSEFTDLFEDGYVEPKADEKAALIAELQSGNYKLSFSSLSAFAVSPRAFIAYKLQEEKNTAAMLLGSAVHCLILEPEKYAERYFIAPDVNGATKEGKEAWKKIYADFVCEPEADFKMKIDDIIKAVKDSTGVIVLPGKVDNEAKFRARSVLRNSACRYVLNSITETEVAVNWEFCGINFRGFIDAKGHDGKQGIIADLKNMPDATLYKAQGAVWSRRLHWQAFGYDRAMGGGNACHIIAVDGNGETSVHCFSDKNLWSAERQLAKYCYEFKRCILESMFDPTIWDSSQDFWLKTDMNQYGINYL